MEKLLTVVEAAEILNCHKQTVYRNKELPCINIPGVGKRFKESELTKYLEQKSTFLHKNSAYNLPFTTVEPILLLGGECGSMKEKKIRWNYGYGSVYIRKTKQGKVRWYVDYQTNGKRVREVVKNARDRAEAVLYLQEKVAEAFDQVHGITRKKQPITFYELGDTYLQNYAKINKKSWKEDMYRINAHLKPFFGELRLKDINPLLVEQYRAERLEMGVTKSTVNREITIMKKMLNLAIDWDFTDSNPVLKVKLFSERDRLKERILSEKEESRLLCECPDYLKPILVVALNTGMRRGEILNLKWDQIDFSKRNIRVDQTKSGKIRVIPMNDLSFQALSEAKSLNGKSEHVFPNPGTGKPFTEIKKSFKNACSRAKIKDLRFHDLRHTFATRLIESGVDLITVRDLLGHFSVRVTQRYTHSCQNQMQSAVRSLVERARKKGKKSESLAHICHIDRTINSRKSVSDSLLIN